MKVYSPRVGAKVLLKVENAGNGAIAFERERTTTVANAWEEIGFDFSTINTANVYNNIVLIFEFRFQIISFPICFLRFQIIGILI